MYLSRRENLLSRLDKSSILPDPYLSGQGPVGRQPGGSVVSCPGTRWAACASRSGRNGPPVCAATGSVTTQHVISAFIEQSGPAAHEPVRALPEHRHAARTLTYRQASEFVGAVTGQGPEPLGQREVGRGEEVNSQMR